MNQRILSFLTVFIISSQCIVKSFVLDSLSSCERRAAQSWRLHAKEPDSSTDTVVQDANKIITNSKMGKISSDSAPSQSTKHPKLSNATPIKRKLELAWCNHDACYEAIREKVVGEHNHMELTGPATGQVVYTWDRHSTEDGSATTATTAANNLASPPAVLVLVKKDDDELLEVAVEIIEQLMGMGLLVLVDSRLRGELENFETFDTENEMIRLFDPQPIPGFGSGEELFNSEDGASTTDCSNKIDRKEGRNSADQSDPDLIVTLGGDGLLMYAAHVFSGPAPPILPVAGGSMGFLTPFAREEMLEAILISLGLIEVVDEEDGMLEDDDSRGLNGSGLARTQRTTSNMQIEATTRDEYSEKPPLAFGNNYKICISMRMRLDCRIFAADGSLSSRYAVLNEVVIDRGSSPYLASLECFCDDVHLTTVQADGIIFSTPTGSTAYSMAAGGSVVHPAVPAIMVTPICPHVLSFRPVILPDHVVLSCHVPSDARSTACVHFDGKHRTELYKGESVQIQMSSHPVPTINRVDHSADWLSSLKRNFNFNTRVRPNPL